MNITAKNKEMEGEERRTANMNVRLYPSEYRALELLAVKNKMNLSEYVRIKLRKIIKNGN